MGHHTCKSMERVLCVVRRSDGNARKCKQHRLARIPLQFLHVHVHPLVTRSVYICVISTLRGAYTLCPHYRLSPTSKHDISTQCLTYVGPPSATLSNIGETWDVFEYVTVVRLWSNVDPWKSKIRIMTHNIAIQMKENALRKTFMMISNWKKPSISWSMQKKYFSIVRANRLGHGLVTKVLKTKT